MARKKAEEKVEKEEKIRRHLMRKLVLVAVIGAAAYRYTQLDDSKKRFIKHLAKQVPYLPARYFA